LREARENAITAGGDDDANDNANHEDLPIRSEVLDAFVVIDRYMRDSNEPSTQKMVSLIGSFCRELCLKRSCSIVPAKITTFFARVQLILYTQT
jgi:hypothetical protein